MRSDAEEARPVPLDGVARPPAPSLGRGLARITPAAGVAALRLRAASLGEGFADAVRRDLDGGLALPGLVVVFACGIGLYFHFPSEPWPPAVTAVAGLAVAGTWMRRRAGHPARLAATLAALLIGIAAASWETRRVAAPRLDHERTVTVEGRVVDLEGTAAGGLRLVVDVHRMEGRGLRPETTPTRITATLGARGGRPDVGDGVRFKARLKPPEGPVMPGGYDFARRAWFEGRGAGGYVLGRVETIDLGPTPGFEGATRMIGSLRHAIAERVRASLPGESGTIAAALMVGEQRAIPESAAEPLRASGLTHIVSISGLHMGLVAGGVIVVARALLALFPVLALGFPIKKWAAAAAFVVATIYLLLSGNQVAALRSHLMLSVALLAVLVDRPAITMHTVAVAAAVILAFEPSAVMEPSFRMSFLAVIALVASYDVHRALSARRASPRRETGVVGHVVGGGLRQIEGFAVSSLVAGLATAPVIAGTFFRAAPYSILANMAVLPVTGLVVMPSAIVAALAMPFGLEVWPLAVMGLGIEWMIAVGRWAAALPAGAGLLGEPHPAMMPFGMFAVLWLSALKSRIRLFGLVPAVVAVVLVFAGPRPDVLIGRHGTAVAVRGADGRLHVLGGRQERFDVGIWLAADRDPRPATTADLAEGWRCDPLGCVHRLDVDAMSAVASGPMTDGSITAGRRGGERVPGGGEEHSAAPAAASRAVADASGTARVPRVLEIAVVRDPRAFEEDCRRTAIVVTTLVAPPGCRAATTVFDRLDLARAGATTLDFTGPVRPIDPFADRTATGAVEPGGGGGSAPGFLDPTSAPEGAVGLPAPEAIDGGPPAAAETSLAHGEASSQDAHEIRVRRAVRIRTALPSTARPWTPIDPRLAVIEREVAEVAEVLRTPATADRTEPRSDGGPDSERSPADAAADPTPVPAGGAAATSAKPRVVRGRDPGGRARGGSWGRRPGEGGRSGDVEEAPPDEPTGGGPAGAGLGGGELSSGG
ncbi:MAG: ComEC/Rec2 family competence protein [Siculibacillus sp.]|nr:ComEC/Rec2 family competence protein [Siculibacillus sp.]